MTKALLIGIDGLDPVLTERWMAQGLLPCFSLLAKTGAYRRLATSNPAQSPVAWSSIATGTNPGGHGLFDFICRDRRNYLPQLAIKKERPPTPFGSVGRGFQSVLRGVPFWKITSEKGIPTSVLKWPLTFPADALCGKMLSGLGVPCLKNTLGRYTLYTTAPVADQKDRKGDIVPLHPAEGTAKTFVTGPNDKRLPLAIQIDTGQESVTLDLAGNPPCRLKKGHWSDWMRLDFAPNSIRPLCGIAKFYLEGVAPHVSLYQTSIHTNPEKPMFPISYPESFTGDLASTIGLFHTLGLPEETNGLMDKVLSFDAFLQLIEDLQRESERMLWRQLDAFESGVLAFVFDTMDRAQHAFWAAQDVSHPAYDPNHAEKFGGVIRSFYQKMDKVLEKILQTVGPEALTIVVSDHGFNSFRKAIHVNSWLVQQGLMVLKTSLEGAALFEDVDWKKTKVYALGFSSIYLNLKGREARGIVVAGQAAQDLKRDIIRGLEQWKDPQTTAGVIQSAYDGGMLYRGQCAADAPDIIVGTAPGYRFSWETAVGAAPRSLLEINTKSWSGDHIMDPSIVPGILFLNRKITKELPTLLDIAPTVLHHCGIPPKGSMEGDILLDGVSPG